MIMACWTVNILKKEAIGRIPKLKEFTIKALRKAKQSGIQPNFLTKKKMLFALNRRMNKWIIKTVNRGTVKKARWNIKKVKSGTVNTESAAGITMIQTMR